MTIRSLALAGAFALSATALAACGDDSSSPSTTGSGGDAKTTTAAPVANASLDTVLACLKAASVDAKDQSNSMGEVIGIDYSGGRTVISFETSPSDAEAAEIAANGTGDEALRVGNVVVSFAADPAAADDRTTIETCLA